MGCQSSPVTSGVAGLFCDPVQVWAFFDCLRVTMLFRVDSLRLIDFIDLLDMKLLLSPDCEDGTIGLFLLKAVESSSLQA